MKYSSRSVKHIVRGAGIGWRKFWGREVELGVFCAQMVLRGHTGTTCRERITGS